MALKNRNILLKKPARGGTPAIEKKVIAKQKPIKGFVFAIIIKSSIYFSFFKLSFLRTSISKEKLEIDINM
jgi:hypothetical protein